MPFPAQVVLIEDESQICELVAAWAAADWPATTRLICLHTVEEALPLVRRGEVECLLLDMALPGTLSDIPAIDALMTAQPAHMTPIPIIIVSGADPQRALDALKHGAQEWVSKDDPDFRRKVTWAISQAWARFQHRRSLDATLRKPLELTP